MPDTKKTQGTIYCCFCHVAQPLVIPKNCGSCGKLLPTTVRVFTRVRAPVLPRLVPKVAQ